MLISSDTNSMSPLAAGGADLASSTLSSGTDLPDAIHAVSSLRTVLNAEGTAPRMTEIASTMATSSSSDKNISLAASSNCDAMLKLTENARSEPREFNVPAALMVPPLPCHFASTDEIKLFSEEADSVQHGVDLLPGSLLSVRMLLLNLANESATGRGGKAKPVRSGRKMAQSYGGVVFGSMLCNAMQFARANCSMRTSEAMEHLRGCLLVPGQCLMSCTGVDTAHLLRGFASCTIIRRQSLLLRRSQPTQRIDTRYGKSNTVLSISVVIFFVFSLSFQRSKNIATISVTMQYFLEKCRRILEMWNLKYGSEVHRDALDAETRALKRGAIALRAAKLFATKEGLRAYEATQVQLSFLSKGMWPAGRKIDSSTQNDLCSWILTEDFARHSTPELHPRPNHISATCPIPLSELHTMTQPRDSTDHDCASTTGESSAGSSFISGSSASSVESTGYDQIAEILASYRRVTCKC
jgi:hypothetical protein